MAEGRDPHASQELADGENPSTTSADEARAWIRIYGELVESEGTMIRSVRDRMRSMSPAAQRITEQTNLPDMERDAERFQRRLTFWQDRLSKLAPESS